MSSSCLLKAAFEAPVIVSSQHISPLYIIFLFSRNINTYQVMPGQRLPWTSFSHITREKQTFNLLSVFFQLLRVAKIEIRTYDKHFAPTRQQVTTVPCMLFWARCMCCSVLHNPHRSISSEFADLLRDAYKTTGERYPIQPIVMLGRQC